jgi:hypothetical protein
MAFKYRQSYFEDGDIVDPRDWNRNITELTDELNGYLDRDNIPEECFYNNNIKQKAFNDLRSSLSADSRTISGDITTWQQIVADGTRLGFASDTDALAIVEWSGTWEWNATSSTYDWNHASGGSANTLEWRVGFRLVVDGIVVGSLPSSTWCRAHDSAYMCGAIPLPAGNHIVQVDVRIQGVVGQGPSYQEVILKDRELICWLRKR